MAWRIEPRAERSRALDLAAPALAVAATIVIGSLVFSALGYDGLGAAREIFLSPLADPQRWPDLGVKSAPLVLIAVGLSFGFRANVWNIGAEGQYVVGAIAGTGVALAAYDMAGYWILPAMLVAGALGGAAYAAIPALLRTRFKVSEILSSLMLSYVALQLLYFLVRGPWRDPQGYNFPQTRTFTDWETLPAVVPGTVLHLGVPIAFLAAFLAWIVLRATVLGFEVRVVGLAPAAARYAGFEADRTAWRTMLAGGAFAGLAGILEAAGPFGQLTPQFPQGYGYVAIIVAFLGRLHPLGIALAGIVMAVSYVGGETAQTTVGLPGAAAGVFQALMLFCLLAVDMATRYRLRRVAPAPSAAGARP
ncbi:MAG: ABC transporter permease [Hyphomicrobiales bacterium]|nr:ABC transporter permease [Hyphomicrobiales bacterium]MDE2017633.1 ABC transporter permease [Hyphomicrobiales bacterium]